jgi:hypothetical protein
LTRKVSAELIASGLLGCSGSPSLVSVVVSILCPLGYGNRIESVIGVIGLVRDSKERKRRAASGLRRSVSAEE